MATTPTRVTEPDAVRQRRAELRDTLAGLETAVRAPADRPMVWGEALHRALARLAEEFALHVEVTEGAGGLHQAILFGDLRLANPVAALTAEHTELAGDIAGLLMASEPPVTRAELPGIRDQGIGLLARLLRHSRRGADLIVEAYETDIGGGD